MENLTGKQIEEKEIAQMTEEDIISKLMEPTSVPESTYRIRRLGIPITLKGLSEKEINRIKKECTYSRKERGGRRIKELDDEEFNAALIEAATVTPDWNNPKLLDALKASDGRQVIKKKFLAGETSAMGDKVLELSGFDDELEKIENIKN
ncbi:MULTISPECIES: phage tail assembly chaperone [Clostridium]|uniref:Phage XkdN-like protein n=1 Tax=Clostridium novyi B str. ATCC 27606 TaxID=1443123 RepID=A0AA40M4M0_CLONO|nr:MULTISPECIES: hypothetical protein [Clostridium]KEH96180.1 phage protein XkdN [Clostridium botulinum D str. 16868]KEI08170.1 phage XkdN-like protein [Clostridium novyi B str. NCTC 9691]KEI11509.1 phage XkdN-like protein [Clostridium novyi B str. ATCC 27606]KLU74278.1 putative phage protein XkdN [Clostridium botulinum V891]MCD3202807.1 hypothetical protein [Clostridium botulinum C/D]